MWANFPFQEILLQALKWRKQSQSSYVMQMTQAMSLLKAQAKTILDIGYDHLGQGMAIVFYVHALHL